MERAKAAWDEFWGSIGGKYISGLSVIGAVVLGLVQHNSGGVFAVLATILACLLYAGFRTWRPPSKLYVPYHVRPTGRRAEIVVYGIIGACAIVAFTLIGLRSAPNAIR